MDGSSDSHFESEKRFKKQHANGGKAPPLQGQQWRARCALHGEPAAVPRCAATMRAAPPPPGNV
jgi:hypothetical protein